MPKIDHNIIDATFFLYESASDARAGTNARGTGFILKHLVWLNDSEAIGFAIYGVTNQHVASQFSVIRINEGDKHRIIELGPEDWEFHPAGDDIAVVQIDSPVPLKSTRPAIDSRLFIPEKPELPAQGFGVGDDAFMVGLFVDHEGVARNNPLVRFGNISMMPKEDSKIIRATGDGRRLEQLSFVVDMHSRSGFSGSPVFVYRTMGSSLASMDTFYPVELDYFDNAEHKHVPLYSGILKLKPMNKFALMGVHWGQFPERYRIHRGTAVNSETEEVPDPLATPVDGAYIGGYSGMTLVVPAWKILEVLGLPKLQSARQAAALELATQWKR
jgi:hypothetical protein